IKRQKNANNNVVYGGVDGTRNRRSKIHTLASVNTKIKKLMTTTAYIPPWNILEHCGISRKFLELSGKMHYMKRTCRSYYMVIL
uniref:Uncharacterized protein n=1 Tax=Romanomermis culicivorax TaxID=13658 RepID=A0A915KMA9_ROMCU